MSLINVTEFKKLHSDGDMDFILTGETDSGWIINIEGKAGRCSLGIDGKPMIMKTLQEVHNLMAECGVYSYRVITAK